MFSFKKKKKKEDKEAEGEENAEQATDVAEAEVSEDEKVSEDAALTGTFKSGIDLQTTLVLAAVGLSAVVLAFVVILKISKPLEEGSFDSTETNSTSVVKGTDGTPQIEDNAKSKQESKEKAKKVSEANAEIAKETNVNDDEAEEMGNKGKYIVPLESIVANLGGVESRRYLRVLINLEIGKESDEVLINNKMIMIRDKLISFFSERTAKDIETEGNVFKLRLEIKNSLNKLFKTKIIKQVYFSDFIVQ